MHSVGEGLAAVEQLLEHENDPFINSRNYNNYPIVNDDSGNRFLMTASNYDSNVNSFNTIHYNNCNNNHATTTTSINQNNDHIRLMKPTATSSSQLSSLNCKFWVVFLCWHSQIACFVLSPFCFVFLHTHTLNCFVAPILSCLLVNFDDDDDDLSSTLCFLHSKCFVMSLHCMFLLHVDY